VRGPVLHSRKGMNPWQGILGFRVGQYKNRWLLILNPKG
jgi:hypothetical protein